MNQTTRKVLAKLEEVEWFHDAGKKDIDGVGFVSSWLQAITNCAETHWLNTKNEAANLLRERVQAVSRARYNQWNVVIREIDPHINDLLQKKCSAFAAMHKLPGEFMFEIRIQMRGIGLETEYSDITEPGFFTNVIASCYLDGHFPCGWEGAFPEGRLLVY